MKRFLLGCVLGSTCFAFADADRPNILFLTAEDTSAVSIGCYDATDPNTSTPHIDSLAKRGILFENCYCMSPVCAPSRFTMVTGLDPVTCGPAHHMRAVGKVPPGSKSIPQLLREAGYYTSNWTKTDYNANVDIIRAWNDGSEKASWTNRPTADTPFYSVFNFFGTHESAVHGTPNMPQPLRDRAYVRPYMPDTPEIRAALVRHSVVTTEMDTWVGNQLALLEAKGLADNTIIFFSSDHGNLTVRSKRFLQSTGIQVPLIAYFPPKWAHLAPVKQGSRVSRPVSQEDFGPTFLALAGLPQPDYMKGIAFAGKDVKAIAPRNYAFSSRCRMDERYDMSRSAHDGQWLYIRNFCPDIPYVENNQYMFAAGGWRSWARTAEEGKLTPQTARFWGIKPTEELYDTRSDPNNMNNLAAAPAHAAKLAEMRDALRRHMIAYLDNGLLPEGCAIEGYEASRDPSAWDVARTLDMAWLASDNDPQNITALTAALRDPSMPIRWWAAAGLRILGKQAAPAKPALVSALGDPADVVRVEAANALVRQGGHEAAFPVLLNEIVSTNAPCALQAANVIYRMGKAAAPVADDLRRIKGLLPQESTFNHAGCASILVRQALEVIDGKATRLTSEDDAAGTPR